MTEPVALSTLKVHLRLDESATDEDVYLAGLISAARRACEAQINCSIVGTSKTLVLDAYPKLGDGLAPLFPLEVTPPDPLAITLPGGAVASITSIAYFDVAGDEQTLAPGAYVADLAEVPARIAPDGAWPATAAQPGAVIISYVISPLSADDLAVVAQAMLLLIGGWYRNRESVQVDARGVPAEIPLAVTWLLQPLRQWATE